MLAYCPALDFDPMETQMTFEQILTILADTTRTDYQKAADIHALWTADSKPENATPRPANWSAKARKPRGPNKPKPSPDLLNGNDSHEGQQ